MVPASLCALLPPLRSERYIRDLGFTDTAAAAALCVCVCACVRACIRASVRVSVCVCVGGEYYKHALQYWDTLTTGFRLIANVL